MTDLRELVLLSVQRALLGMVTPDLRAVEVTVHGARVEGVFAYDGEVTDEHLEIVSEAEGMVIGDLDEGVDVRFTAKCVRPPEQVGLVGDRTLCYLRREP